MSIENIDNVDNVEVTEIAQEEVIEGEQREDIGKEDANVEKPAEKKSRRKSHNDEVAELRSQIEELRAIVEISRHNDILDNEVVSMLVKQGHSVDELRKSKPYLFKSQSTQTLEQPRRIIAPTKLPQPESRDKSAERMTNFVNTLASMITGTQPK